MYRKKYFKDLWIVCKPEQLAVWTKVHDEDNSRTLCGFRVGEKPCMKAENGRVRDSAVEVDFRE
jgi:hypothetical protein